MDNFEIFLNSGESPNEYVDQSERSRRHDDDQFMEDKTPPPSDPVDSVLPSIECLNTAVYSTSPSAQNERGSIFCPRPVFKFKLEGSEDTCQSIFAAFADSQSTAAFGDSQSTIPDSNDTHMKGTKTPDTKYQTSSDKYGSSVHSHILNQSSIFGPRSNQISSSIASNLPTHNKVTPPARKSSKSGTRAASNGKANSPARALKANNDQNSIKQAALTVESDDDDDIMEITPDRASAQARLKWSKPREPIVIDDEEDGVFIKKEPQDTEVTLPPIVKKLASLQKCEEILAAQRALINIQAKTKKDVGPNCNWTHQNLESNSNGSGTSKKRRDDKPDLAEELDNERTQMNAAMRDGEDHSWMNEEPQEDDEFETLTQVYDSLLKRKNNGKISPVEIMELHKVHKRLQLIGRLRAAATQGEGQEGAEDGDPLFIPESRCTVVNRHINNRPRQNSVASGFGDSSGGMDSDGDTAFSKMLQQELSGQGLDRPGETELTNSGNPKKKRGKVAKTAREVFEREIEKNREKEVNKLQRKKAYPPPLVKKPSATKGKGKGKSKAAKAPKKGKGEKTGATKQSDSLLRSGRGKFNHWNGQDNVGQRILEDLLNNDPIAERLQNPIFDNDPEPELHGRMGKQSQFQKLVTNIPEGSSKKDARSDKSKLLKASKSFGFAMVKAQDGKWLVKGMNSTLYHHQLLGAQWMVQRELSNDAPHGGLLADSMGLGKTVQTIACMIANPPMDLDKKRRVRATLIVAPATVIDQWIDEIKFHAGEKLFPKVLHYRASSQITVSVLEDLDIVLTSYNEVMKQFPFPSKDDRETISRTGHEAWWKDAIYSLGVLHQVNWYRVVLDEAHAIKNNSARTSLACQNLKSVYRWCLTGTPLLNRLEELFPYLRFLKADYSMDWATFRKYFCDPHADDCQSRIATLLSCTMMRRTMKTSILNRPIITLPTPHPFIKYVHFSPEEKIIYRITENRFRANINQFFAKGQAAKSYGIFMVQLLRLRQCTSHPFMLERTIKESWTLEDVQELHARLNRLTSSANLLPFYEQTKVWVEQSKSDRDAALARGEKVLAPGELLPFGKGDFGNSFNMDKPFASLNESEMLERVSCGICSDFPRNAVKTDCGHIFCEECLATQMNLRAGQGDDYNVCPTCERLFATTTAVTDINIQDDDEYDSPDEKQGSQQSAEGRKRRRVSISSKGRDMMGFEPATKDSTWVSKSDGDPGFPLAPSAKTVALKAILLRSFAEAPMDKVVIYVQFRTLARIVGRICESEDWGFLYLTGDTSTEHRTKVIKRFRDDAEVKILIAGLKCGGLGLNFPWANRCISLDLWWNHAVEQQAFGRIFRIGQEKETYMTRIVVKNSVDLRLLTMQLHKLENCERAIRDGEDKEKPKLSLRQLANLFGFLKTDEDDNIIAVEPDYDDNDDDLGLSGDGDGGSGDLMDSSSI